VGSDIGLEGKEVEALLKSGPLADEVRFDEQEARELGITGVPFFAFDRRLAVSGAQSADVFLGALEQAWSVRGTGAAK